MEKVIGRGKAFNRITRFDKYEIYQILNRSTVSDFLIPTHRYKPGVLMKNIKSGYNLILKPRRGSLGKNVYKLAKEENEFRLYYQTIYPKSIFKSDKELIEYVNEIVWSKKRFIIQPFISFAKVGEL